MQILLISGKAGSGKDTFANYIYNCIQKRNKKVLRIHFADLVKYYATNYYNWNGEKDAYGRALLQTIGTDKMRAIFPNYWAEIIAKFLFVAKKTNDFDYVLIPDWRFYNEYTTLLKYFNFKDVITIRVMREGLENNSQHISETELDNDHFQWIVENISLSDLEDSAKTLFNYIEMVENFKGVNND